MAEPFYSAKTQRGTSVMGWETQSHQAIARIWMEVLGVPAVDADANFFDIGGDSMKAMEVILRVSHALHVELPLMAFFEDPTVEHLGAVADELGGGASSHTSRALAASAGLDQSIFETQQDGLKAVELVEQGLATASIDDLRERGLTFTEVHDLVLPARTLKHRIDKSQVLSSDETERVLRVAKILLLAEEVFANHEKALRWLRRPKKRLNERAPLHLLRSEAGGDLVRQMLYQIDEGIYV